MIDTSKEKVVYLVRHGAANTSEIPTFLSRTSPLTDKGRRQAELAAERFAKMPFDALIASPFTRAKETAEAIERTTGKRIEFSDLFVERVKPSSIDGKLKTDEEAKKLSHAWEESLFTNDVRVQDGENYNDIVTRADSALCFLETRNEQVIVVVSHGFFLRTILARILLGDVLTPELLRKFQTATITNNTGISVINLASSEKEGMRRRVRVYNDHAHLS